MGNLGLKLFYATGLTVYLYVSYLFFFKLDFSKVTNERVLDLRDYFDRYLTSWNVALQIIYFTLALSDEILSSSKNIVSNEILHSLYKLRGFVFFSYLFPASVYVVTVFWTLTAVDSENVLPKGAIEVLQQWLNQVIHTGVIVLPLVEVTMKPLYIPRKSLIYTAIFSFTLFYNIVFCFTYYQIGRWLYGVFDNMSLLSLIIFFTCSFIISMFYAYMGVFISSKRFETTKTKLKNNVVHGKKKC